MERLHLDFLQPHARRGGLGVALLVAGAVVAGVTLVRQYQIAQETARLEERVLDARRMARRAMPHLDLRTARGRPLADEIRAANVVIERLNVPWDALFRELEAAEDPGVTLLAIQPDAATGQVRIAGEARKLDAVFGYVSRLEEREGLHNVYLIGHEVRDTPSRPVAFSLLAQWKPPR
jgi:hypothetical protein